VVITSPGCLIAPSKGGPIDRGGGRGERRGGGIAVRGENRACPGFSRCYGGSRGRRLGGGREKDTAGEVSYLNFLVACSAA